MESRGAPSASSQAREQRIRTSQAVLVLCSPSQATQEDADQNAEQRRHVFRSHTVPADLGPTLRSWADPRVAPHRPLVEEVLRYLQQQYTDRVLQFEQKSGANNHAEKARICRACADPTPEYLRSVCSAVRRGSPDRIVFHYSNYSVAQAGENGRLSLYNKDSNEYRPVHVKTVHEWLGGPAMYIFDCPAAGELVEAFDAFLKPDDQVVVLGVCGSKQPLPWEQQGLPSDFFTSCLTSPIKTALTFYRYQTNKLTDASLSVLHSIGGRHSDRNSPMGELVWIFTAITDAIAWSSIPPHLFQRLYRQDAVLAGFFRNFLLAVRILSVFGVHAESRPALPATHSHQLWDVWDSVLELCLLQVTRSRELRPSGELKPKETHHPSSFFEHQMEAFSVWLRFNSWPERSIVGTESINPEEPAPEPPTELPILLQGLLHCSCRMEALKLLTCFVDMGGWAVYYALMVGIKPYLIKLLSRESTAEVTELLLCVWTKILVFDQPTRNDLLNRDMYMNFLNIIRSAEATPVNKGFACMCIAIFCHENPPAQIGCAHKGGVPLALAVLRDKLESPVLRHATLMMLSDICRGCPEGAQQALKGGAVSILVPALRDKSAEVRSGAVSAIGAIVNSVCPVAPHDTPILVVQQPLSWRQEIDRGVDALKCGGEFPRSFEEGEDADCQYYWGDDKESAKKDKKDKKDGISDLKNMLPPCVDIIKKSPSFNGIEVTLSSSVPSLGPARVHRDMALSVSLPVGASPGYGPRRDSPGFGPRGSPDLGPRGSPGLGPRVSPGSLGPNVSPDLGPQITPHITPRADAEPSVVFDAERFRHLEGVSPQIREEAEKLASSCVQHHQYLSSQPQDQI